MRIRFSSQEFFNSIECKAALRQEFLDHRSLTGSLHPKQSFKLLKKLGGERRESANSGQS